MHELSAVEGIRELVLLHARSAGASRVLSVRVVIADFSSYHEDALAMYWGAASAATEAAGARIDFVRVSAEAICLDCTKSFRVRKHLRCPGCGSEWVKLIGEQECYIESIEVETPEGCNDRKDD